MRAAEEAARAEAARRAEEKRLAEKAAREKERAEAKRLYEERQAELAARTEALERRQQCLRAADQRIEAQAKIRNANMNAELARLAANDFEGREAIKKRFQQSARTYNEAARSGCGVGETVKPGRASEQ
jgi:hypothetical protein